MKLKNQGKRLGGLLFLSFFLAPGVHAKDAKAAEANWYVNINRAMMHVNDGFQKDTYSVDNYSKSSRAGITGEKKLDNCLSVGGKLELEFASASTSSVNQLNRNNVNSSTGASTHDGIQIRQVDTWIKSPVWGQFSLGHGGMASWNAISSDLSGTADTVGYLGPFGMASGMYFHTKDSTSPVTTSDPRVANVFGPYDGLARKDRIRYDSPAFAGFSLSTSVDGGEKDNGTAVSNANSSGVAGKRYGSDVALRYANTLNGVKLLGAVSLYKVSKGSDVKAAKVVDASFAALHQATGINIALQAANKTLPGQNLLDPKGSITKKPKFQRVALGLVSNLNCYGSTNFVVDYTQSKNSYYDNDKSKGYGLGVVQGLKKINSELYVAVRQLKYDRPSTATVKYDKMLAAMAGIRVSFGGKLAS